MNLKVPPKAAIPVAAAMGAAVIAMATPRIERWEGVELRDYKDLAGVVTACSGHTKTAKLGKVRTPAECRALLTRDVEEHAAAIRPCVPAGTPIQSQAAFLSLAFNIGPTAFCGSSAARRLKEGNLKAACHAIGLWNKARVAGRLVTVKGLVNRRADEVALCLQGVK